MSVTIPPSVSKYSVVGFSSPGITVTAPVTFSNPGNYYAFLGPIAQVTGTYDSNPGSFLTDIYALQASIVAVAPQSPIPAPVGNNYTFTPGSYFSSINIGFNAGATLTFDAQGDSNAQFLIIVDSSVPHSITFPSITSINLINGASNCNVFWSAFAGAINFTGTSPSSFPGIFIANYISFTSPSQILGSIYAISQVSFSGISSVNSSCESPVVCYAKGTKILTQKGYVAIENIKLNDKIVTKGTIYRNNSINLEDKLALSPVIWTSKFKVRNPTNKSRPICIKSNAFGQDLPSEDLYVSPGHRILINGKMVQAKKLVNGKTIFQDSECNNVEYYHLELESHSAIIANGVLSESYLDLNNRQVFEPSKRIIVKKNFRRMSFI